MGWSDFVHDIGSIGSNIGGAVVNTVKAGEVVGEGLAKGTAWAANPTHWDDIGRGAVMAGKAVEKGVEGSVKGVGWLATHPSYWDDAAKQMIVSQFTDPVNIATNVALLGLTVATGGAAAPAWMAKVGLGAKAATEAAEVTKAAVEVGEAGATAAKIAEGAQATSRIGKFAEASRGIGQGIKESSGLEKVGKILDAPSNMIKAGRSELLGTNELGLVQRGRNALADKLIPSVKDTGETANFAERYAYRKIASGPGLAEEGAQTLGSNVATRVGQVQKAVQSPQALRNKVQVYANVTAAVADPEQAGKHLAHAAWNQYGDDAMKLAWEHKGQILDRLRGKDGDKAKAPQQPFQQLEEPSRAIGLEQFRLDNTRSTRTSRRQPGQAAQLGTVTANTALPSSIGPKNWYGPQGGYNEGRGFRQQGAPEMGFSDTPKPGTQFSNVPQSSFGAMPSLEQPSTPAMASYA